MISLGQNSLDRLRSDGYCKGHYDQMRPKKFTIYVRDMKTEYHIDTQYEILVRLSLSLFAANPDTWAVIYHEHILNVIHPTENGKGLS